MNVSLPNSAGIGFKPKHLKDVLGGATYTNVSWVEVHPENYMGEGGPPHQNLNKLRVQMPLSMHGVGMSLGSAEGIDEEHLNRLAELVNRYEPASVSEHMAWSHWNQVFLNDLLPMPYTKESLAIVGSNVSKVQDALKRPILVENPSLYLKFEGNEFSEASFFNALVDQTGCGLLFDVNNLYVSANNLNFNAQEYLDELRLDSIGEVHLAGHATETLASGTKLLIDDHGSVVCDEVWLLYQSLIRRIGESRPTLIEWDTDTPDFEILNSQAGLANRAAKEALTPPVAKKHVAKEHAA